MMNLSNQECVCVCVCVCVYVCVHVLDTNPNIFYSHIPPEERKYTASLREIMKNTEL